MKICRLMMLWLFAALAVAAGAQTNQAALACRNPFRVFGGSTVNLTPLFRWWVRQPQTPASAGNGPAADISAGPDRPLSAWRMIVGTKVGELERSWIVDAAIYTSPTIRTNARLILVNPPAAEEQAFDTLTQQLAQAAQQISYAQRDREVALRAEREAKDTARGYLRWGDSLRYNNYLWVADQKRAAATAAQNRQRQLEALRPQLQKQIEAMPSEKGEYRIALFALDLGRIQRGFPIYNAGVIPAASPLGSSR